MFVRHSKMMRHVENFSKNLAVVWNKILTIRCTIFCVPITISLLNTNVDGNIKIVYALTTIKGVGRRYSNLVCKKADVDLHKRAGELTQEELERIVQIMQNPTHYKIPAWFLNRQNDITDGKDYHTLANNVESKLRDDLERLKKIRAHRGIRHFWGLRVRGQHTKTTGRRRA